MKAISTYITEKFQVSNNNIGTYTYTPKDTFELIACIKEKIEKEGYGTKDSPLDLNDIDTSNIIDISNLFCKANGELRDLGENGYFDISEWDVSNVEDMYGLFWGSRFDGDISCWNVSKVRDMSYMFSWSKFAGKNGDISKWDVSNVENMEGIFSHAARFKCNLDKWNTKNVKNMQSAFYGCPAPKPKWYKK